MNTRSNPAKQSHAVSRQRKIAAGVAAIFIVCSSIGGSAAAAPHAPTTQKLFDTLAPTGSLAKKLLTATTSRDEKSVRALLVAEGFDQDVLGQMKVSFDVLSPPWDPNTVYVQPSQDMGPRHKVGVAVYALGSLMMPGPVPCNGSGYAMVQIGPNMAMLEVVPICPN